MLPIQPRRSNERTKLQHGRRIIVGPGPRCAALPLHEIWAPPSSFAHAYNTDNIEEAGIRGHWEKVRNELPKALKQSIVEYRVFELPRLPGDPKEGLVRLAVGDGLQSVRFREEIDEFLERWEGAVDR